MHIVFVISNESSVPYFNWFAEKASKQTQHTFSFVNLFNEKPKMIEDVAKYGVKCYWINYDQNKRKLDMITSFFQLYSLFKKIKPDVVHTHLFDASLPGLLAARLAGVKKRVITKADTSYHYFHAKKWMIADKFNNWNATHIVPASREAEQFIIEKEHASLKKIFMIHHGIPKEIFANSSPKYQEELIKKFQLNNKIVIGSVSRMVKWKGYDNIVKAIPTVVKEHPNAIFIFVGGDGDQKEFLQSLAKQLNVQDYIIYVEWIDRAYMPSFYSILDVFVHAANFEPFGFVIPEAMMNAAPIVSTPTGAALDAISHKVNGYLAEYKNYLTLAEGINYMIKNKTNFRYKGKKTALDLFDFDKMWTSYINLYTTN